MKQIGRNLGMIAMALLFGSCALVGNGQDTLHLRIEASDVDRTNAAIVTKQELPATLADANEVTFKDQNEKAYKGYIARPTVENPELANSAVNWPEIHLIIPALKKSEVLQLKLDSWRKTDGATLEGQFHWVYDEGKSAELRYGDKSVLRYMHEALDESSPQRREETYKVFHHLFDPTGQQIITKGAGGKYTHHRGLFFGFNKITYGADKHCDVWHCKEKAYQSHESFDESIASPVLGRHTIGINWHGEAGEVFVKEIRDLTAWKSPQGVMIEFHSILMPFIGPVILDGDPQHAGFHFRASNEVAESTASQTYYLRPDGKGGLGETRNWPDQPEHINLPWNAMSFVVGGKRYTALYLDHPTNPKEARFSERDYGRFGSYFQHTLDWVNVQDGREFKILEVRYRIWLQEGEMTVEQANALSADFVNPVRVTAEWK